MDTAATRGRASRLAASSPKLSEEYQKSSSKTSESRNPPLIPTPSERLLAGLFPAILIFGTLFSIVSPQTRGADFDPVTQSHSQISPPSYFAHKGNVFNRYFVKQGWVWVTGSFALFALTHPALATGARKLQAFTRYGLVTLWWFLVTQWFFGPALIDRGFRLTGGACQVVTEKVEEGEADPAEFFTAVACKAAGGRWMGGHDISGHVFLLVLGSGFLLQEVGWAVARWAGKGREERAVMMKDGAVKGAGVESATGFGEGGERAEGKIGLGGKVVLGVVGLNLWMLLMTAIYFHTWFEKLTGLITAILGLYAVYIIPRLVPAVRQVNMASFKVPGNLPQLIKSAFAKARANGDLLYFQTQVTVLAPASIPFQLRFSPALASKPTSPLPHPSAAKKVIDPFDNPSKELLVAELHPDHNLVLNKFAIVPEHFILATKGFREQTHLLDEDDLAATYACISAYHDAVPEAELGSDTGEGELFAFFNSGEFSGSSQPHRHIQLLPVARMREDISGGEWDVLAKRLVGEVKDLPFTVFAANIEPGLSGKELRDVYLGLYRQACVAVAALLGKEEIADGAETQTGGEARISYNMAMTRHALIICPRLAEGGPVWDGGEVVGKVSFNGTVLAGTALVKSSVEWDALRNDPMGLFQVLKAIGVPKKYEDEVLETTDEDGIRKGSI
ncbi:hypothetical protein jhhlp_002140 [Lomentospora prolificans]|uniref:Acyl-coenzyme A diphosphatase SCS3 n=1 Tax=Lomentospora prolificans TaxID=41688 RepID=A0A2N3ND91_9PEZI|nr:hypothetical protein jhhlp_002140 [Lomentospora prolificans]